MNSASQEWERNIQSGLKPNPKSSRETKVNFIKSKYCLKSFCTFDYIDLGEENVGVPRLGSVNHFKLVSWMLDVIGNTLESSSVIGRKVPKIIKIRNLSFSGHGH